MINSNLSTLSGAVVIFLRHLVYPSVMMNFSNFYYSISSVFKVHDEYCSNCIDNVKVVVLFINENVW